jgi:hypothetical protein
MTNMQHRRARGSVVLVLAVALAACSGPVATGTPPASVVPASAPPSGQVPTIGPSPLSSPTEVPSPSIGQTPEPVVDREYPELAYANRFVMRVAVSDLNVREKPSTSARSNGKAPKGGLFMVSDWPIQANGYTWYFGFTLLTPTPGVLPDLPTYIDTGYDEVLAGWMATGTEDTPFLLPLAPRCPSSPDLASVAAMFDSERIICFGAEPVTLEGTYGCEGCGGATAGTYEPEWLASPLEFGFLSTAPADGVALPLHFGPGGPGAPAQGSRVRVRGHFSDERAATCRITEMGSDGTLSVAIANEAAAQWCRGKFVVDNVEVIG